MSYEKYRDLVKAGSQTKYPRESTFLLFDQSRYARELIATVRSYRDELLNAYRAEGTYRSRSKAARRQTIGQVITAISLVESFLNQQERRNDEGFHVQLISGNAKSMLEQAFVALFYEMKDFHLGVEAGEITFNEDGDVEVPEDFDEIEPNFDVVMDFFSNG